MNLDIATFAKEVHQTAWEHGFWDSENKAEKIALMHSELSEALEAVRSPQMSEKLQNLSLEVEEFADVIIRVLDYCEHFSLPIVEALQNKNVYNQSRPWKHGKSF